MNWQRVNEQNLVRQRDQAWDPQEVLGSRKVCWCGQPFDHEWLGKSEGAEHPKAAEARSAESVDRADIAEFYRLLADLVEQDGGLYVINHEVSYRELPHVLAELRSLADTHARQARSAE